jgi:hypothetical protein
MAINFNARSDRIENGRRAPKRRAPPEGFKSV